MAVCDHLGARPGDGACHLPFEVPFDELLSNGRSRTLVGPAVAVVSGASAYWLKSSV